MKQMSRIQVQTLIEADTPPCVSIYVPLKHAGQGEGLDGCYRNLLETTEQLLNTKFTERVSAKILEPLKKLSIEEHGSEREGTLVLFKSPVFEGYIVVAKELPGLAVVSESFHIKPLLEILQPSSDFYLLSLGMNSAVLYRGNSLIIEQVRQFTVSTKDSFEILLEPTSPQPGLLSRAILSVGFRLGGRVREALMTRFYASIDVQVSALIGKRGIPLILEGSRKNTALYRETNSLRNLRWAQVRSSPLLRGAERIADCHVQAARIAKLFHENERRNSISRARDAGRRGALALGVGEVVKALGSGEVETLLVRENEMLWGRVDWSSGNVIPHPCQIDAYDEDVLDDCVEKAVKHGIRVVMVEESEFPEMGPIGAIRAPFTPVDLPVIAVSA